MNRITRNLSIIYRAERLIQQRRIGQLRKQTGMMIAASILGGMGLVALNVAGFFALKTQLGEAGAALIVAVLNLVLAAALVFLANKSPSETGIQEITEVRDMAIADLEAEVSAATEEARQIAEGLRSMARDPIGSLAPGAILPILRSLLKMLKS